MAVVTTLKQKVVTGLDHVHLLSTSVSANACTMTVKSCAPRTAANMARMGVKCGWMLKRNEQRTWQPRFCCIVPHTFLYYFESPEAEVPRGVIDLEYYTEITADPANNVIMLSAGRNVPLRTFYLRADDDVTASEWISSLHRERYRVVRDERDAYMGLQSDFSSQIEDVFSGLSEAVVEKNRVKEGLRAERSVARDHLSAARRLAVETAGVTDADVEVMDMGALLAAIKEAVGGQRHLADEAGERERAAAAAAAAAQAEISRHAAEIGSLTADLERSRAEAASAKAAAAAASAALASERARRAECEAVAADVHRRLEEARLEAEQGQVNLGIMAGERRAAEAAVADLTEQKKVLVREVKGCRRALLEAKAVNERLAAAYESLERTLRLGAVGVHSEGKSNGSSGSLDARAASSLFDGDAAAASASPSAAAIASSLPVPPSPSTSSSTTASFEAGWGPAEATSAPGNRRRISTPDDPTAQQTGAASTGAASALTGLLVRDLSTGDLAAALQSSGGEESGGLGLNVDKKFIAHMDELGTRLGLPAAWRRSSKRSGSVTAAAAAAAAPSAVSPGGSHVLSTGSASADSPPSAEVVARPAVAARRRSGAINVADLLDEAPTAVSAASATVAAALESATAAAAAVGPGGSAAATAGDEAAASPSAAAAAALSAGAQLSSAFNHSEEEDIQAEDAAAALVNAERSNSDVSAPLPARKEADATEEEAAAANCRRSSADGLKKVLCLRCGGTVEGPVYSTCQCKMPLLTDAAGAGGSTNAAAATAAAAKSITKFRGVLRSFGAALDSAAAAKLRALSSSSGGGGSSSGGGGSDSNNSGSSGGSKAAEATSTSESAAFAGGLPGDSTASGSSTQASLD